MAREWEFETWPLASADAAYKPDLWALDAGADWSPSSGNISVVLYSRRNEEEPGP